MEPVEFGYHRALVDVQPGAEYVYRLDDGRELPDPASRLQAKGVHGPSTVVDTRSFEWKDRSWKARPFEKNVFYELHVGTYTAEGTFEAVIPHLPGLVDLGITTLELMPVAQFPGSRNWGYDGVYLYAAQSSYGGPEGLQRLVNAAHGHGLAVALDVVYNHLGPEGNYLSAFGPYFTNRYQTPWGEAINYDGEYSDKVRRFFIENALYWLEDFHFDALRLDAVHGIFDFGARHFVAELKDSVSALAGRVGRPLYLVAESDLNDSRLLHDQQHGGHGLDAQWTDDFHHSVHTLLTREDRGYYADFGGIAPLAATLQDGWFYQGQYSAHRRRRHGNSPRGISPGKFVVYIQNHDQVGNRAAGDRLSTLVEFEALKLAAGVTLLSPFVPLLFMGEEYGERNPFQYFTSDGDSALVEAVRKGRKEEFASFGWQDAVPDPQDPATFERSRLNHASKEQEPHRALYQLYRRLLEIRSKCELGGSAHDVQELEATVLVLNYPRQAGEVRFIFNFSVAAMKVRTPDLKGTWEVLIQSAGRSWNGPEADVEQTLTLPEAGELRLSPYSFLGLKRIQSSHGD